MRKLLAILMLVLCIPFPALAANCTGKTCIDVTTDPQRGGIVITATQNSPGHTSKPRIRATPHPVRTPVRHIAKVRPKPTPSATKAGTAKKIVRRVSKAARTFTPKVVAAVSLSDSLMQLIPLRSVYSQPAGAALTGLPVFFWTDTSTFFATTANILGIAVGVSLHPNFEWDFGDGAHLQTTTSGAAYPTGGISHVFSKSGRYLVRLAISWSGTWSAGGNNFPVLGDVVVQNFSLDLVVAPGPTHYLQ